MLRVRLLGAVSASTGDGRPADVGPPKCQALLAALALSAGTAVPVWRLVDLVWGPTPPRTAERTLQSYVTRLRRGLGTHAIARLGSAYRLDVPPEAVDVLRFQRRLAAGDVEAALAEWTGVPLAGLIAPGLTPIADGLLEQWASALETDLTRRAAGDPAAVVGRLTELTAAYPHREGLWALLMTALYRCGRQGDALAAYHTARRYLMETLGLEPSPHLREVESWVLGHDVRLLPGGTGRPPDQPGEQRGEQPGDAGTGGSPNPRRRGNLPRRLGRLLGRDGDLDAVAEAMVANPVVTLVGPGGIGKTRLALAAASRVVAEDGAWLVDLAQIGAGDDVARAVAGALGIKESAAADRGEAIVAALAHREALLVLDNCEHVTAAVGPLARAIVEGCPRVRVLATSREALGVDHGHERLVAVPPLEPSGPGAELFIERAAAARGGVDLPADRPAVEEICRRLDGLPLAIELAAARTSALSPPDLLRRLDDHLGLLVDRRPGGPERHRTLQATVSWSYDLLSPTERLLLERVSVFVGPFDLAAAEAVAADAALPVDAVAFGLGGLVERSMLAAGSGRSGRRFRLLETVRGFAAERLRATGGGPAAARRHARWCAGQVAGVNRMLRGLDEVEGVARLDELWPNLRAAFDWAIQGRDRDLAYALTRPIVTEVVRRGRAEIGDWLERLLDLVGPAGEGPMGQGPTGQGPTGVEGSGARAEPDGPERPDDRDLVLFALTWTAQRHKLGQNPDAYRRLLERAGSPDHPLVRHGLASVDLDFVAAGRDAPAAIACLRGRGDDDLAEQFELDIAAGLVFGGRFDEGDATIAALVDRYRRQGPPTQLNLSLMLLGYSASLRGDDTRAARLFDEAVAVDVPDRTQSPNGTVVARTMFRCGQRLRAFDTLRSYVEDLLDTGAVQGACVAGVEFVTMMAQLGRTADAALILDHVDRTAPYWAALVEEARRRIAADGTAKSGPERPAGGKPPDDRWALEFMRQVLGELTAEPGSAAPGASPRLEAPAGPGRAT